MIDNHDEYADADILYNIMINEREKSRYFNWPVIDTLLPITMDNGHIIEYPTFHCTVCDNPTLHGENLRGEFRVVPGGDLRLTGYGRCSKCNVLSTIRQHYRQQSDGTVEIQFILRPDPIPLLGAEIIPFEKPKRKRRKKDDGKKDEIISPEDRDNGC